MGSFVIAAYRPREGKEEALLEALRDHLPILREEGLATDRPPVADQGAADRAFQSGSGRPIQIQAM